MGKVLFVREEDIDFCFDFMVIKGVYCQTPDVRDPSCSDGDLETLKKCLLSPNKSSFKELIKIMCDVIKDEQPDMKEVCYQVEELIK